MKKNIKNLRCAGVFLAFLGLIMANHTTAQTLTALHRFSEGNTNDGNDPVAGLVLSGKTLYGVTVHGGTDEEGVVFALNTDGTGYTNLHNFGRTSYPQYTNADGAAPLGPLILSSHKLYGTTEIGGIYGYGTVFSINTDGSDFTILHSFANSDGAYPLGGLLLSGRTLYGTTWKGGSNYMGTIFKLRVDGSGFTVLHVLSPGILYDVYSNADGAFPEAGLVLSGTTLYGTASGGGNSGSGTVFALQTDGTGFTNLHSFSSASISNYDGIWPRGGLVVLSNILYGTTQTAGVNGGGTLFAINTDGTGFQVLHPFGFNDGSAPLSTMLLFANTLYGTTAAGGPVGTGTIFSMKTDGTSFTLLNGFTNMFDGYYGIDGSDSSSSLVHSGHDFYGTANSGEVFGDVAIAGTVFKLSLAPKLNMSLVGRNLVLTWPANFAGFDYSGFTLQCSTNPASPNSWVPVSPVPASVNGQYVVTNANSGTQIFYRR